ncbi:MAG: hypothetical protein NVV82_18230 [Sporocytophaga sp.]|nr:hypothetical protein [Sporocytophaga sp.]
MKNLKRISFIIVMLFLLLIHSLQAQEDKAPTSESSSKKEHVDSMQIYGFGMGDGGYNFDRIDPDWYDVVRPTKLPAFKNEFQTNGNTFFFCASITIWCKKLF